MKKDGTSSLSQTRRQLDFRDKPYQQKTFYLDIKAENIRRKVIRRLKELGGQKEEFLSKDVQVLLTDSPLSGTPGGGGADLATDKAMSEEKDKKMSAVPLSRGKALLLKATQQSKSQSGANAPKSADIVQNALNLGVKVEKATEFLKSTQKLIGKLRRAKTSDKSDTIEGIVPIHWQNHENQNLTVVKFEDEGQLFKPVIKHLEKFPQIQYNENLLSPFDKTVILQRTTEKHNNRYSTKHKNSAIISHKGGFCEPCDHWYKCSLREHLNSVRHQKFVKNLNNFEQLDAIISKMPTIADFTSKFIPCNMLQEVVSDKNLSNNVDEVLIENPGIQPSVKADIAMAERKRSSSLTAQGTPMDISNNSSVDARLQTLNSVKNSDGMTSLMPLIGQHQKDSEMEVEPFAVVKDAEDECSKDSGTGPELRTESSRDCVFNNEGITSKIHKSGSDSALQQESHIPDEPNQFSVIGNSMNTATNFSCNDINELQSCDNAVFLDITDKANHFPVQVATSAIRKKLSSVSISDTKESLLHVTVPEKSVPGSKNDLSLSLLTFSGIDNMSMITPTTSPKSHNVDPSFVDIAAGWMKDMSNKSNQKTRKVMNKENIETSCSSELVTNQRKCRTKKVVRRRTRKSKTSATSVQSDIPNVAANEVLSFYQQSLCLTSELNSFSSISDNSCTLDRVNINGMKSQSLEQLNDNIMHHQSSPWPMHQRNCSPLFQQISSNSQTNHLNTQTFHHFGHQQEQGGLFSENFFPHQQPVFHGNQYSVPLQPEVQRSPYYQPYHHYHQGSFIQEQQQYMNSFIQNPSVSHQQQPCYESRTYNDFHSSCSASEIHRQSNIDVTQLQQSAINTMASYPCDNGSDFPSCGLGPQTFSGLGSNYHGNTVSYQQNSQVGRNVGLNLSSKSFSEKPALQSRGELPRPFPFKQEDNSQVSDRLSCNLNSDTEAYSYSGFGSVRFSQDGNSQHSLASILTEVSTENYSYHDIPSSVQTNEDSRETVLSELTDNYYTAEHSTNPDSEIIDVVSVNDQNELTMGIENCDTPTNNVFNKTDSGMKDGTPTNNFNTESAWTCELKKEKEDMPLVSEKIPFRDVTNQPTNVSQKSPTETSEQTLAFSVKSILSKKPCIKSHPTLFQGKKYSNSQSPSKNKKSVVMMDLGNFNKKSSKHKKSSKRKRQLSGRREEDYGTFQYVACPQEGGMKLKLCKIMVTPLQQKQDLKSFWKVRKAGGCRLLFSAEKNKHRNKDDVNRRISVGDAIVQQTKRRKCSV